LRDDPLLIVTCGGPLTNIAAALRLNPSIASKIKLVWIGGAADAAGGYEYNLSTDIAAARYVLEESSVPVWQIRSRNTSGFRFPSRL
jgi:inosine-uridine nucleoside N-ribohydrolase